MLDVQNFFSDYIIKCKIVTGKSYIVNPDCCSCAEWIRENLHHVLKTFFFRCGSWKTRDIEKTREQPHIRRLRINANFSDCPGILRPTGIPVEIRFLDGLIKWRSYQRRI